MRVCSGGVSGGVGIVGAIITRVTASTGSGARGVRLAATSAPAAGISLRTGGGGGRLHILGYQHAVKNWLDSQLVLGEVEEWR